MNIPPEDHFIFTETIYLMVFILLFVKQKNKFV